MKRILVAVFSIMMLLGFINTTQVMASESSKILVTVDKKTMALDRVSVNLNEKKLEADVPGVNYKGNTLTPVRALAEKLGAEVKWDESNKVATIKTSDKTIELKQNSFTAKVDGKEVEIPNKAAIESITTPGSDGGRTMAPLRFISEALGADVKWVKETNTANITSKNNEVEKPVKPEEDKKPVIPVIEEKPEIKLNRIKSIIAKDVDGSKIPEIHIEAESEIKYKDVTSNSKTLVIDIADSLIDEKAITENCNAIEQITAKQITNNKNEKTVRITIQLNEKLDDLEYEIKKDKKNLKIKIINKLAGIEMQTIDGREAIVIRNVYTSKTNSFSLSNPNRLVVDVRNTNLNNIGSQVSTDIVKELRLGQYTGHEYDPTEKVARVVLDISENYENPSYTTEERGNDLIIFVEGTKKAPVVEKPKPEVVEPPKSEVVIPPSYDNNTTTKQKVIVIDAGHGGSDPGAVSNGLREKDLTLSVALKTRDKLEALGYKVIMTRATDSFPSLGDRYKLANAQSADAFISIHINAATAGASGIETFYTPKSGQDRAGFAKSIQDELINSLGAKNRGVKTANFAVIKNTNMVSILTELGFITNVNEAKQLSTDSYQEKAAAAIANGAHRHLSK